MPVMPVFSGRQVVQVFLSLGWQPARQRGCHIILIKPGHIATLSVPDHRRSRKGLSRSLIRAAGLTAEVFATAAERV